MKRIFTRALGLLCFFALAAASTSAWAQNDPCEDFRVSATQTQLVLEPTPGNNGVLEFEMIGGTPPYILNYQGTGGGQSIDVNGNTLALDNLRVGQIVFIVTDAEGCSFVDSILVRMDCDNSALQAEILGLTATAFCESSDCVLLEGSPPGTTEPGRFEGVGLRENDGGNVEFCPGIAEAGEFTIVYAVNYGGCFLEDVANVRVSEECCPAPNNLAAAEDGVTETQADISWNEAADAVNYRVRWRPEGADAWTFTEITGDTEYQIEYPAGLSARWEVEVCTRCESSGDDLNCNSIIINTQENVCAPAVPVEEPFEASQTSITPRWNPVDGALQYFVEYRAVDNPTWQQFGPVNAPATQATIPNLNPGTDYLFRVITVCASGASNPGRSEIKAGRTLGGDLPCIPPSELVVLEVGEDDVLLEWTEVPPSVLYQINYREVGTTVWIPFNTENNFQLLQNLKPCTQYEARVEALCPDDQLTAPGPIRTFTTECPPPPACGTPQNVFVARSSITSNSARVEWDEVPGAIRYRITYCKNGVDCASGEWFCCRYNIHGLTSGTEYAVTVTAICDGEESLPSAPAVFETPFSSDCPTPQGFQTTNLESAGAGLGWNPSENSDEYIIEYWLAGSDDTSSVSAANASAVLSNLLCESTYEARLRAVCPISQSPWTDPLQFSTLPCVDCQGWTRGFGASFRDWAADLHVDLDGNVLVAGSIEGNVTIDGLARPSIGAKDAFIAKYNNQGTLLWVEIFGGTEDDEAFSVTADASGNVYATGYFTSRATFGGEERISAGRTDVFVVKYSASGAFEWARRIGSDNAGLNIDEGSPADVGYGIFANSFGGSEIMVTGQFSGAAEVEGAPPGFILSSLTNDFTDMFLVAYDEFGNYMAGATGGGAGHDVGKDVLVDLSGFVTVAGEFTGQAEFANTALTSINPETADIFLAQYDVTTGGGVNAARAGGVGSDLVGGIDFDDAGNIYLAGGFDGDIDFAGSTINSSGRMDAFLASYSGVLTENWLAAAGGPAYQAANDVAYDAVNGRLHVTGIFQNAIDFGAQTFTSAGNSDIFRAEYDLNGSLVEAFNYGGTEDAAESGFGIDTDIEGHIYMAGQYASSTTISVDPLSATGADVFVAKFCVGDPGGNEDCPVTSQIIFDAITATSGLMAWDPVPEAEEGYIVIVRPINDPADETEYGPQAETTLDLEGLDCGTTYEVEWYALCPEGERSSPVFEVFTTGACDEFDCARPPDITATEITCNSAQVSWESIENAESYNFYWRNLDADDDFEVANVPVNAWEMVDLLESSNYQIKVRAVCAEGESIDSPLHDFPTPECECPIAADFAIVDVTGTTIEVSWTEPDFDVQEYWLRWKKPSDNSWVSIRALPGEELYEIVNLTPCSDYEVQLRSRCGADFNSDWLALQTRTTECCQTPRNFRVTSETDNSIFLAWSRVPSAKRYEIYYSIEGEDDFEAKLVDDSQSSYQLFGLEPNTDYEIFMRAICDSDEPSENTDRLSASTTLPCDRPGFLTVSDVIVSGMNVEWGEVPDAAGYEISYKRRQEDEWTVLEPLAPDRTSYRLNNLLPGNVYDVRLRTICRVDGVTGYSGYLTSFSNTPTCEPVQDLRVVRRTQNTATLRWTPVSGALEYYVEYRVAGGTIWDNSILVSEGGEYTIFGLQPGTNYQARVVTICGGGADSRSVPIPMTTEQGCRAPLNITANIVNTDVILNWDGQSNASGYMLYYREAFLSAPWDSVYVAGGNSYTLRGLRQFRNYEARVRTICPAGASGYSGSTIFRTDFNDPDACRTPDFSVRAERNALVLTWSPVPNAVRYEVSWKRNSFFESWSSGRQNDPLRGSYQILNLSGNTEYVVRLRVFCEDGISEWNESVVRTSVSRLGMDEENNLVEKLSVYPNPNRGRFSVRFDALDAATALLTISDLAGRAVHERELSAQPGGNEYDVELPELSSGVYVLQLRAGDAVRSVKLVIE